MSSPVKRNHRVAPYEGLARRLAAVAEPPRMGRSPGELLDRLEHGDRVDEAILAGHVLALLGDPRIRPDDPPMADLPAARVAIGTPWSEIRAFQAMFPDITLEDEWLDKQCPRHEVDVRPFRLGVFPVTNGEFRLFLEDRPDADVPSAWQFGVCPAERANHPVCAVSVEGARRYCEWLSKRTGRRFRLPREAEWEYAAGGVDGRTYPWGDDWAPGRANTWEEGLCGTTPVGAFRGASPFGCRDMGGNVEEWVDGGYYVYPGGRTTTDWFYQNDSGYCVTRGGSFNRGRDLATCRRRHGGWDGGAIGFRLAEDPRE